MIMGEKINVAELLKYCPKGMELDCTMFDNVTFVRVNNGRQFPIEIAIGGRQSKYLTKEGCFHDTTLLSEAKCIIFPKGKASWEGFVPPCKFKVGDRIRHKTTNKNDIYKISKVYDDSYGLVGFTWMIYMKYQDQYELVQNKFDLSTLVPFESRVLVRNSYSGFWMPTFWGVYETEKSNEHQYRNYLTTKGFFRHCIPYNDDTKHLVGKTDDCDEFYKTWE